MTGKAVLTCRPNSHPFPERTLTLEQPVKIGRSVARARPAANNAIFDCKVLSRNHALIWYNNGKFYLQDTKSSNGTFVNNHRLSKSGEESLPREVCSGDIVQFGVDVLENTRKVTHGCIVANLKLYLPDGKEAKASLSTTVQSSNNVSVEHLYELHQYLQEAIQREQLLESKLIHLQEMLNKIRDSTDEGWKALIAEDRLLTRVDALESQLVIYCKNFGEDKLKEELKKLQEDKNVYQNTAKEFLKKVLEEKLEAVQKYQDVSSNLMSLEVENNALNEELKVNKTHVQELAQKLNMQTTRSEDAELKILEIEEEYKETLARLQRRNDELTRAITHQKGDGSIFSSQLGGLRSPASSEKDDDEELRSSTDCDIISDAAALFNAQIELLQYLDTTTDNQHIIEQAQHNTTQIKTTDLAKDTNGCEDNIESKPKSQIFSEDEIKESKGDVDYCRLEETLTEDLKTSNELTTKSSGLSIPSKPEKPPEEFGGSHVIKVVLDEERKLSEEFLIDRSPKDDFEIHLNIRNQNIEEKDMLRKQLSEAEQAAKHHKNEAAQLSDRLVYLMAELDALKLQHQEQALDNKLRNELQKLSNDCLQSKGMISFLQNEISSLKENCEKLLIENARLNEDMEEFRVLRDADGVEEEALSNKIAALQDNLVVVSQKYMETMDDKTKLKRQLSELQLDYEAISHQPYFNLFFALPCILLILAITIAFYPTLSNLMGTSDSPNNGQPSI